ncbi:MAG: hypothetical protein WC009_07920 [Methylotenera sp.]
MAITKFNSYWKHQLSLAPDVDFTCVVNSETCTVEVSASHFDSRLFLRMALDEFQKHGVNAVFNAGFSHGTPDWKVIFSMGEQKFKIEVFGVEASSKEDEYTVLLQPFTS